MKSRAGPLLFSLFVAGCTASPPALTQGPQVRRILADDRYEWVTVETENTRIHFPSGSYAETQQGLLPARAEESRRTVLSRLSVSEYQEPLHLFYVDGREDMENLTGSPVTGSSYYDDHAIATVLNDRWRALERHELTHTVTLGTWTSPADVFQGRFEVWLSSTYDPVPASAWESIRAGGCGIDARPAG